MQSIQEQVTSAAIRGGAMGLSGGCEEVRWKQDGELRKRERRRRVDSMVEKKRNSSKELFFNVNRLILVCHVSLNRLFLLPKLLFILNANITYNN